MESPNTLTVAVSIIGVLVVLAVLVIGIPWFREWVTNDRSIDNDLRWADTIHALVSDSETDTHPIIGMAHYRTALEHIETVTIARVRVACDIAIARLLNDHTWETWETVR